MPLLFGGILIDQIPCSTANIFQCYPHFQESAALLCAQEPKIVGPAGLLYVSQREFAVTVQHDKCVTVLGSDDATTCHIVLIRHSGSGVVSLAHFDGCGLEDGVKNLMCKMESLSGDAVGRFEVHIVGGFQDDRGISEELTLSLLQCLHKQPKEIILCTLCVGELNSIIRGGICWPIIYGIGVHVKTGDIFPATFSDKGPELPLRSARNLTGLHQMSEIYDCVLGVLRIGPFSYEPLRGVDLWLTQSDHFILQHLSTSSQVEPPHFVAQMRATLLQIQQHPFPSVTVFPGNKAHEYGKDEMGYWTRLRY